MLIELLQNHVCLGLRSNSMSDHLTVKAKDAQLGARIQHIWHRPNTLDCIVAMHVTESHVTTFCKRYFAVTATSSVLNIDTCAPISLDHAVINVTA